MWVKARDSRGSNVWLNLALARSIVRVNGDQAKAKTLIGFDSEHQITVRETPEQIFDAIHIMAQKRRALKIADPRNADEVAKALL